MRYLAYIGWTVLYCLFIVARRPSLLEAAAFFGVYMLILLGIRCTAPLEAADPFEK